jgi:hypothetical protein
MLVVLSIIATIALFLIAGVIGTGLSIILKNLYKKWK